MALCADYKIPHSAFLDWAPEDRAKALAFFIAKAQECSLCGTSEWEWQDDKHAYVAEEKSCRGCMIRKVAQENSETMPGVTVELVKNTAQVRAKHLLDGKEKARARAAESRKLKQSRSRR